MRTIIDAESVEVVDIPAHPDGDDWTHVVGLPGQVVFADTATEAVGAIIGAEYDALLDDPDGDDAALGMRYEVAVGLARVFQRIYNEAATTDGWNPGLEDEDVLTALHQAKTLPYVDEQAPGGFGGGSRWEHRVPLVLIATDYAPYTPRGKPEGNVVVLDPSNETNFLTSLSDAKVIEYLVLIDA